MRSRLISLLLLLELLALDGCTSAPKEKSTPPPPQKKTSLPSPMEFVVKDPRWSDYEAYLQNIIGTVQAQWYLLLQEARTTPPHGSSVTITFRLSHSGEVDIVKINDDNAGKLGVIACANALTSKAPYGKWSDEMRAALGPEQTLTFSFYYQ